MPGVRGRGVEEQRAEETAAALSASLLAEKLASIGQKVASLSSSIMAQSPQQPLSAHSPLIAGGYLTPQPIAALGIIMTSLEGKTALSSFDRVYLQALPDVQLSPGDRYLIVRQKPFGPHPLTGKNLGYLVSVLGDLRIQYVAGTTATAVIHSVLDVIALGDQILTIPLYSEPFFGPSLSSETKPEGYIVGDQRGKTFISLFDVVYIDRGSQDGITPGDFFTVLRSQSLSRANTYFGPSLSPEQLPVAVGTVQIMNTQEATSTALVISSLEDFSPGSKVVYSHSGTP